LAAGIPVIVERGIANQDIIEENKLGLVVDSLEEAAELVKQLPEETYQQLVANVRSFNPLLRNGYFTRRLLIEAICAVYDKTGN
ncbi:beta-1,6-galactofuranosyltransferase, partial [Streptococcus suis]